MGDIFDAQESGELCSQCGAYTGGDGPNYCSVECESAKDFFKPKPQKVKCFKCDKMLVPSGVKQHMEAKHGAVSK